MTTQTIRVAGALAEISITELIWHSSKAVPSSPSLRDGVGRSTFDPSSSSGTSEISLLSRRTDLPGLLATSNNGSRLTARALKLTIERQATGLYWSCSDPQHAKAFADALSNA